MSLHDSTFPRSRPRLAGLALVAVVLAGPWLAGAGRAASPPRATLTRLYRWAQDSTRADTAEFALRRVLASDPDSADVRDLRQNLVQALMTRRADAAGILAACDSAMAVTGVARDRLELRTDVALHLVDRQVALEGALREALAAVNDAGSATGSSDSRAWRGWALDVTGQVMAARGQADSAAARWTAAIECTPNDAGLLRRLADAQAFLGRADDALATSLRAASVFGNPDTSARAAARERWATRHGSLAGFDDALARAAEASRHEVVAARAASGTPPAWGLPTLGGRTMKSDELKGRVQVLTFWGTWSQPCLPYLQKLETLYEDWAPRGVKFVAINWERPAKTDERRGRVVRFIDAARLSVPVVMDTAHTTVEAFHVDGFPCTIVCDAHGRVRYRNLGYSAGDEDVLAEQLRRLLEETPRKP